MPITQHPYPEERFAKETKRILKILDEQLQKQNYMIGDEYSIADIANENQRCLMYDLLSPLGRLLGMDSTNSSN